MLPVRGGTGLRDFSLRSKLCCCDRWGNTIGNANTELLVLTGWAAWQFAASRHDVLDW